MRSSFAVAISLLTLPLGAAAQSPASSPQVRLAVCHLQPTSGSRCRGTVRFQQVEGGVRVTAQVTGLTPGGKHGFHIHELGDLSAPDGTSAGGHFDPQGHPHAGPAAQRRHAGDLGNLEADAQGNARYEATLSGISVAGQHMILGRSVVVHEKADDLTTQPTGGAGARIAVGVIGVAADTTPPTVKVLAPREGQKLNANPVNVVVEVQDDLGVAGVTIAGKAAAPDPSGPGRWRLALSATRGANQVQVVARDVGGNEGKAQVGFAFNDKPPVVEAEALLVVSGKVDDLTCTLTINGQKVAYDQKTGAYSARVAADPKQPSKVTIVATDEFGNSRTELRDVR